VGASGTAPGVALAGADAGPVPIAFVAVTVNEYAVPLVRPVTVQLVPVPPHVAPPGLAETVYPVIALPPFDGAVQASVTWLLPAVATRPVGAPGTVAGADGVAERSLERAPSPTPLTALTE
jgi:hypothetical protein